MKKLPMLDEDRFLFIDELDKLDPKYTQQFMDLLEAMQSGEIKYSQVIGKDLNETR